jgi:hypothetical protein
MALIYHLAVEVRRLFSNFPEPAQRTAHHQSYLIVSTAVKKHQEDSELGSVGPSLRCRPSKDRPGTSTIPHGGPSEETAVMAFVAARN